MTRHLGLNPMVTTGDPPWLRKPMTGRPPSCFYCSFVLNVSLHPDQQKPQPPHICIKYVSNMYQVYRSYISKTTTTSFAKWWPTWRSCLGGVHSWTRGIGWRIGYRIAVLLNFCLKHEPIPSRIRNTTQNDYCSPLKWIDAILNHDLVWGVFDIIGKGLLYISFPESQPLATGPLVVGPKRNPQVLHAP